MHIEFYISFTTTLTKNIVDFQNFALVIVSDSRNKLVVIINYCEYSLLCWYEICFFCCSTIFTRRIHLYEIDFNISAMLLYFTLCYTSLHLRYVVVHYAAVLDALPNFELKCQHFQKNRFLLPIPNVRYDAYATILEIIRNIRCLMLRYFTLNYSMTAICLHYKLYAVEILKKVLYRFFFLSFLPFIVTS